MTEYLQKAVLFHLSIIKAEIMTNMFGITNSINMGRLSEQDNNNTTYRNQYFRKMLFTYLSHKLFSIISQI